MAQYSYRWGILINEDNTPAKGQKTLVDWSEYDAVRKELEAVKREAAEVLKRADRLASGAANFCDRFTVNDLAADDDQAKCAVQDLVRLYRHDARAFVEKHGRDG